MRAPVVASDSGRDRAASRRPSARAVAADVLVRIDGGAYANLAAPAALSRSGLGDADRHFVTELVYGTTRMRRQLDHLVDGHLRHEPDARTRAALRLGTYQLLVLRTPPHAAVGETVAVAPERTRGLTNAVLRKVAGAVVAGPIRWPSPAVELSYPDWVVDLLVADLGTDDALRTLLAMNEAATVSVRDDDYVQDPASQAVVALVDAGPECRVADVCAAPGGKATGMASSGAFVVASDVHPARARLVAGNARRTGVSSVATLTADAVSLPLRDGAFDRVLVDAPCSGLGVLRRRPDARWRVDAGDVARLAALQRQLLTAAAPLVRPGGVLVYSVCTLTRSETVDVDTWTEDALGEWDALDRPGPPWRPAGRGALLLPHVAGTDGMFVLRLRRPA